MKSPSVYSSMSEIRTCTEFSWLYCSLEVMLLLLYCKNQYNYALFFQVLAGMNVYSAEFERIKEEYNVRGYPTICYFESVMFCYYLRNHTLNYNCMFLSSGQALNLVLLL